MILELIWGFTAAMLVGCAVTIVSLIFTQLTIHHALVIVGAVVLTSVVFALGGFINALFAKNFDQVNWIPTFVLTPLTYFGGVFYSITLLPEWAQRVSYANPILHMVNAFRYGFLGTSDVSVVVAFSIMTLSAVVLFAPGAGAGTASETRIVVATPIVAASCIRIVSSLALCQLTASDSSGSHGPSLQAFL